MNIIPFEHKMSAHCETGTISMLLNHASMKDITEPLAFGIGSGIFFGYFKMSAFTFPVFIVRHKPHYVLDNVCKRLGVKLHRYKFKDASDAEKELDRLLEKGIPVAVQVDFFYMDYLPAWFRVHNNVHFIIVMGKQGSKYQVSDCYYPKPAEVEAESLAKGRFAGGMSAPKGFMYYVEEVPAAYDLRSNIIKGIKKSCFNMLKIPMPFLGVKGIKRFAERVVDWPGFARDEDHLSHEVMQINVFLEDQGTGGAGFRFMFATFLRQASEIIGDERFMEMAKRMMAIGDKWREISVYAAKIGKNRDFSKESFKTLSDLIMSRYEDEKVFFNDLNKLIKQF